MSNPTRTITTFNDFAFHEEELENIKNDIESISFYILESSVGAMVNNFCFQKLLRTKQASTNFLGITSKVNQWRH